MVFNGIQCYITFKKCIDIFAVNFLKEFSSMKSLHLPRLLFCSALLLTLLNGCASCRDLRPADISLDELQQKIDLATDPEGRYAKASTSVIRQEILSERTSLFGTPKMQMVEIKTMQPDFFKLTTFVENEPVMALISNGTSCWLVNFKRHKVQVLSEKEFRRMKVLSEIARPGSRINDIFSNVKLEECTVDDTPYYRLTCSNEGMNPLVIYINRNNFLTERITGSLNTGALSSVEYDSRLTKYSLYEGVRMPQETSSTQNGETQTSRIISYKLDLPLDSAEFRPPSF
jgi:hypothetical protein